MSRLGALLVGVWIASAGPVDVLAGEVVRQDGRVLAYDSESLMKYLESEKRRLENKGRKVPPPRAAECPKD